jgi:hypothetical protein
VFARHCPNRVKAPCERSPKVADLLQFGHAGFVGERSFRAVCNVTGPCREIESLHRSSGIYNRRVIQATFGRRGIDHYGIRLLQSLRPSRAG